MAGSSMVRSRFGLNEDDLPAFREQDADVFFGREAEVGRVIERLEQHPIVAVVGPSGAGKSSLVDAGVIPRLRETVQYQVLRVRPGVEPMRQERVQQARISVVASAGLGRHYPADGLARERGTAGPCQR